MLRLRSCIVARLLSGNSAAPLHRLLSAAAVSPNPSFAVEDYLVDTCGLTRAQAVKASTKLSHLKSPTNPDAVLAFLAGLDCSSTDVAALVAKDPRFLCADVEKTLSPVLVGLTAHGLSHAEVARFVSLAPDSFRKRSIVSNLPYYLSLLGSYENVQRVLKKHSSFLGKCPEKLAKPNVTLLRECGLGVCDIAKLCIAIPWLLTTNPEQVQAMVARAEALGVPRGSGMLRQALHAVAFFSDEKIGAKVEYLKKTFRWSDAEVRIAVTKNPLVLRNSEESLKRRSDFFLSEVGLEPAYIAHHPVMLRLSLEGRLRPRHYVVKFLKENGLLKRDPGYDTVFKLTEKAFLAKFICPHKEAAPHLAEDYAAASRAEPGRDGL